MKKWLIIALVYLILSLIFGFFNVFAWCLVGFLGVGFINLIFCIFVYYIGSRLEYGVNSKILKQN